MPGFLDHLLSQTAQPSLARSVKFTAARHHLLAENVANAATPGYVQKDLSETDFRASLSEQIDARRATGRWEPAAATAAGPDQPGGGGGILYHDRNNRSMEELMSQTAKNALRHNAMVELMRRDLDQLKSALRERVS